MISREKLESILASNPRHVTMQAVMPKHPPASVLRSVADGVDPIRNKSECLHSRKAMYYKQRNET